MKTTILFLLIFYVQIGTVQSQALFPEKINFNNASGLIANNGEIFQYNYNTDLLVDNYKGYEIPKGSGKGTIYDLDFWFGGNAENGDTVLSAKMFSVIDNFVAGPIAYPLMSLSPNYQINYSNSVWKVSEFEILNHITNFNTPGYVLPSSIEKWPGNGFVSLGVAQQLAPFVDLNGDGVYSPSSGDYPKIFGQQAVYLIYNDSENPQGMGIEIHLMIYQCDGSGYISNTTFMNVEVFNRSNIDYHNYKQSVYLDTDIGYFGDDFVGCDSANSVGFAYNGDYFDENNSGILGYENSPPCQGLVCLDHPMESFGYFAGSSGLYPYFDPTDSYISRWNYMNAKWADGSNWYFGGNGIQGLSGATNYITKFMYSGNSNGPFDWKEYNTDGANNSNLPGDRRFIFTISEDSLLASTSVSSSYALITSFNGINSYSTMYDVINIAGDLRNRYAQTSGSPCEYILDVNENSEEMFSVVPNPTDGRIKINFNSIQSEIDIKITNMLGEEVYSEKHKNKINLDFDINVKPGVYLITIRSFKGENTRRIIVN